MAKKARRTEPRLENLSLDALKAEFTKRQRALERLMQTRQRLIDKIVEIDAEIHSHGGRVSTGASGVIGLRKRPRNELNLVDALAKVLKGRTLSVTEAAEAVQRAGYQTTSPNFRTIVNQTLIKSNQFKKHSRGRYTAA